MNFFLGSASERCRRQARPFSATGRPMATPPFISIHSFAASGFYAVARLSKFDLNGLRTKTSP
jgi:hypothetical protein